MRKVFFLIILSLVFGIYSINGKLITELSYDDDGSYFYLAENKILEEQYYDCKIKLYDLEGELLHEFGEKGYGPNEFINIVKTKLFSNELVVLDQGLYRLAKYNLETKDITTAKNQPYLRFPADFIFKNDFLYFFGPNKKIFFDPRKECYLISKCKIENKEIVTEKDFINIGKELSQYDNPKKYCPKTWQESPGMKSNVPSGYSCFVDNAKCFILLYSHIGDFFIFDYKTEEITRIPVEFPGYENPTGKNYYKNWKKYSEDQKDHMLTYCFQPQCFIYDDVKKQYRVVYNIPKNLRENHSCMEVIFDSNFQYVSKENLTDGIWRYSKHNGKIYMLNQNREEMTIKVFEEQR